MLLVLFDRLISLSEKNNSSVFQEDRLVAQLADRLHAVAHQQDGAALARRFVDAFLALARERSITDREHLVDDHDVGLELGCDRECKPNLHAARIMLDRS